MMIGQSTNSVASTQLLTPTFTSQPSDLIAGMLVTTSEPKPIVVDPPQIISALSAAGKWPDSSR
jgi:hypothetical protein